MFLREGSMCKHATKRFSGQPAATALDRAHGLTSVVLYLSLSGLYGSIVGLSFRSPPRLRFSCFVTTYIRPPQLWQSTAVLAPAGVAQFCNHVRLRGRAIGRDRQRSLIRWPRERRGRGVRRRGRVPRRIAHPSAPSSHAVRRLRSSADTAVAARRGRSTQLGSGTPLRVVRAISAYRSPECVVCEPAPERPRRNARLARVVASDVHAEDGGHDCDDFAAGPRPSQHLGPSLCVFPRWRGRIDLGRFLLDASEWQALFLESTVEPGPLHTSEVRAEHRHRQRVRPHRNEPPHQRAADLAASCEAQAAITTRGARQASGCWQRSRTAGMRTQVLDDGGVSQKRPRRLSRTLHGVGRRLSRAAPPDLQLGTVLDSDADDHQQLRPQRRQTWMVLEVSSRDHQSPQGEVHGP